MPDIFVNIHRATIKSLAARVTRRPDADAGSGGNDLEVERAAAALVQHFPVKRLHRATALPAATALGPFSLPPP